MAQMSSVDYKEAQAGRIKRSHFMHPAVLYMVQRGATYNSNEFVDSHLKLGEDHFDNVLMIIRSAKRQGHVGVSIRLTSESSAAILTRIPEISAIEWVDVETQRSDEYQG